MSDTQPGSETLHQLVQLRKAVDDACIISWINPDWDRPRETISRLINWNVKVALDPAVSCEAQELIDRGTERQLCINMDQYRVMCADPTEAAWNDTMMANTDSEFVTFKPEFQELELIPESLS